ncbi:MAG: aminopeptidase P family protein [Tannerellaceae bacterium]|jgi:Xaa-Pro aminopeptidase|nr:aminopeptidase P family protein [Tannerellaceae bacterium]
MKKNRIVMGRLASLRSAMAGHGMDAYIVTGSDEHISEYVPERSKTRKWLSEFTGSSGTIVVTAGKAGKAGLWTDSRYFLQAEAQLEGTGIDLYRSGTAGCPTVHAFLLGELGEGAVAALDGKTFSAADARALSGHLAGKGISLDTSVDLFDEIWADRPAIPSNPVFEMPDILAGQTVADKLKYVNNLLRPSGADALLLCALDEVAWLFNIRGNDILYYPVAIAYAFVCADEAILFISPGKLGRDISAKLKREGVKVDGYDRIVPFLAALKPGTSIMADAGKTNRTLFDSIPPHCRVIEGMTPVSHLKSIKNPVEVTGFRDAMLRDGVSLTRFYIWLEKQMGDGVRLTEMGLARKLSAMRAENPGYLSDSFATICAYGPHGAVVHYSAGPKTDSVILPDGLLLIDSGAHYVDGTTDITRTISLSKEPTERMKEDFTLVLKGHIALAESKFPLGTRGAQLDILARKPLWDHGLNYLHGTGHGVGHCLCVHEGPQSIRAQENPVSLLPGMILSNEPGIYREGKYGIRTENLIIVRRDTETDDFLRFDTLTLCYIDTSLVIAPMLTDSERDWLNGYHVAVREKLSFFLNEEERRWLEVKTKAI